MGKEDCVVCLQPITNPICSKCYVGEVKEFLKSRGIDGTARAIALNKIKKQTNFDTLSEEKCILCKKGELNICSYCFFHLTQMALEELNFPDSEVFYFKKIFNYV